MTLSRKLAVSTTSVSDSRPSYIRYCATCDHPEGDHAGIANWHGPRSGPCFRCDCNRFIQTKETT